MLSKSIVPAVLVLGLAMCGIAQETPKPVELEVLKSSVGVWDAEIEVWPSGPGSPSIKFKGVETIRAFGEHWIASDFDSEFMGQTMKIHSIVGYDLSRSKLVGTIIDHGPYAATMTGEYDKQAKAVQWKTEAKDENGKPMVQHTVITQKSADERALVLSVPGKEQGKVNKFMEIKFVRRKSGRGNLEP